MTHVRDFARTYGKSDPIDALAVARAGRCRELTAEFTGLIAVQAPALIAIPGCTALTVAKILGETAGVGRFRSKGTYARHNGTAPLPVWARMRWSSRP
jgi:hypothetical protein